MVCVRCSGPVALLARGDSRYCSTRCRVASHRSLPAQTLRDIPRWVRWSADKVPLRVTGGNASSTDPGSWVSWEVASSSSVGVGVGFVLSPADSIVCVDIDHCLDSRGRLESWARDLLDKMPSTYVEVSPSGSGLHVWGVADFMSGRRTGDVEIYGAGRYITVTGQRFRGCGVEFANLDDWISDLLK